MPERRARNVYATLMAKSLHPQPNFRRRLEGHEGFGHFFWKTLRLCRARPFAVKLSERGYALLFFRWIDSKEMAAGVIPAILEAWPRERGRMRDSFSFTSLDSPLIWV